MNERFWEIVEQADEQGGDDPDIRDQVFAELLIKELARAIANDSRLNDVRSAANGCVRTINEHFGVEE